MTTRCTVVICAYTEDRWEDLGAGLQAVLEQSVPPFEVLLVIDHNPRLFERAHAELAGARVLENAGERGLSDARNTGVRAAQGDVLAFLDDDAVPTHTWLEHLLAPFEDAAVVGVGGRVEAAWPPSGRPTWFPREFDWVVGCSYVGLPTETATVRNPIGASMAMRREEVDLAGGFDNTVGRVGTIPLGCEETELSIRMTARSPGSRIVYVPASVVHHRVTDARTTVRYFARRCYSEGLSKARVSRSVGAGSALSSERSYVTQVLRRAVIQDARAGRWGAALATPVGLGLTAAGYVRGRAAPTTA